MELVLKVMINFNMGCIEIYPALLGDSETSKINFNMGCIEISILHILLLYSLLINFNMGCIEITLVCYNYQNYLDKL